MRVLVVGATGFLGSHVAAKAVRSGIAVIGLVRSVERARAMSRLAGVDLALGSLPDRVPDLGAEPIDAIVYAPGVWRLGVKLETDELERRCRAIYVEGVERLATLAAERGARFVFVSGVTAHGKVDHARPIVEDAPHGPLCTFGRHKRMGEAVLERFGRERALAWTALRPHEIYGDGDPGSPLLHLYDRISRRRFFHIGDGENRWSICNVENFADAALHFARTPAGAPVLVADESPHSWNEIARTAAAALGKSGRFPHVPKRVAIAVGGVTGLLPRGWIEYRTARIEFDTSRARALGFRPTATLEDGIRAGVASWRAAHA